MKQFYNSRQKMMNKKFQFTSYHLRELKSSYSEEHCHHFLHKMHKFGLEDFEKRSIGLDFKEKKTAICKLLL